MCFKWGYKTWNAVTLTDWDQIILSSEVYSDVCNTIKVLMKKCISLKPWNLVHFFNFEELCFLQEFALAWLLLLCKNDDIAGNWAK